MSVALPNVDLRRDHWAIVRDALRRHVPDREVLAFGSRATWTAKDYSDLDLAIMGGEPLSLSAVSALDEALVESDLPFRVDIVDWARIDEGFRAIIRRHAVTVQAPTVSTEAAGPRFENWSTLPFSEAFLVNPTVPIQRGSSTPFVEMAAVGPGRRSVRSSVVRKFRGSGSKFCCGDTLLARITPSLENGKIARYDANTDQKVGHGSTEFIVVRGRAEVTDSEYAFYVTRSDLVRSYAIGQMTGTSGRQRVPTDSLAHLEVAVPPLPEQRAIAHILGTLDDKIELNRRMNETLEEMARALFKSWFVDFEPVRAKMEGRDTGLPKDIADLFPDRLVDSEIGETPEGWEVFKLDRLADHHTKSTSPLRSPEEEYEHFSIPAYDAGQRPSIELGAAIRSNKTVLRRDAVLLSKLNPRIPRVWIPADSKGRPQVCSTEFLVFTPRPPANRSLLFALFADQSFRALLKSMVTGTSKSHQRVPPKALKTQEVLAGSPRVFRVFGEVIGSMLEGVLKNRSEVTTLAALRDTLLPKLISGDIRVPDAERALESAT
ncbi:MAG: restriction endonuclease subunit S [Gammaproteobacteria bacterium]|nr:restriction endonuclease subunit S [Gammaproteobacteria bacterium]